MKKLFTYLKILVLICLLYSCNKLNKGIIIQKHYEADWWSTEYDPSLRIIITTYHPAEYYVTVRGVYKEQPKTESFSISERTWINASVGDSITLNK